MLCVKICENASLPQSGGVRRCFLLLLINPSHHDKQHEYRICPDWESNPGHRNHNAEYSPLYDLDQFCQKT